MGNIDGQISREELNLHAARLMGYLEGFGLNSLYALGLMINNVKRTPHLLKRVDEMHGLVINKTILESGIPCLSVHYMRKDYSILEGHCSLEEEYGEVIFRCASKIGGYGIGDKDNCGNFSHGQTFDGFSGMIDAFRDLRTAK